MKDKCCVLRIQDRSWKNYFIAGDKQFPELLRLLVAGKVFIFHRDKIEYRKPGIEGDVAWYNLGKIEEDR